MIHVIDTRYSRAPESSDGERVIAKPLDIADRLDADADRLDAAAIIEMTEGDSELLRKAAALIRDLDAAISHAIAVKGSIGLSPWAISVLHEAINRQQRRL